jgi:hypothetical protein
VAPPVLQTFALALLLSLSPSVLWRRLDFLVHKPRQPDLRNLSPVAAAAATMAAAAAAAAAAGRRLVVTTLGAAGSVLLRRLPSPASDPAPADPAVGGLVTAETYPPGPTARYGARSRAYAGAPP